MCGVGRCPFGVRPRWFRAGFAFSPLAWIWVKLKEEREERKRKERNERKESKERQGKFGCGSLVLVLLSSAVVSRRFFSFFFFFFIFNLAMGKVEGAPTLSWGLTYN